MFSSSAMVAHWSKRIRPSAHVKSSTNSKSLNVCLADECCSLFPAYVRVFRFDQLLADLRIRRSEYDGRNTDAEISGDQTKRGSDPYSTERVQSNAVSCWLGQRICRRPEMEYRWNRFLDGCRFSCPAPPPSLSLPDSSSLDAFISTCGGHDCSSQCRSNHHLWRW